MGISATGKIKEKGDRECQHERVGCCFKESDQGRQGR